MAVKETEILEFSKTIIRKRSAEASGPGQEFQRRYHTRNQKD
jgi:hypothetical protein